MITKKFITLAAVGAMGITFIATPSSSSLADEQSCNMYYFKAGAGYNFSRIGFKNNGTDIGDTIKLRGPAGEIGFGYVFSQNIRADVTARYTDDSRKDTISLMSLTTKGKWKQHQWSGMASMYYTFNMDFAVAPYLTAGLGFQNVKNKMSSDTVLGSTAGVLLTNASVASGNTVTSSQVVSSLKSKHKTAFMYKVGLGMSYSINDTIALDLEYNLNNRNNGKVPMKDSVYFTTVSAAGVASSTSVLTTTALQNAKTKSKLSHTIMLDLRVSI